MKLFYNVKFSMGISLLVMGAFGGVLGFLGTLLVQLGMMVAAGTFTQQAYYPALFVLLGAGGWVWIAIGAITSALIFAPAEAASIEYKKKRFFEFATNNNDVEMMRYMLGQGTDLDPVFLAAMIRLANSNDRQEARQFLSQLEHPEIYAVRAQAGRVENFLKKIFYNIKLRIYLGVISKILLGCLIGALVMIILALFTAPLSILPIGAILGGLVAVVFEITCVAKRYNQKHEVFLEAIQNNDPDMMQYIVEQGLDLNERYQGGVPMLDSVLLYAQGDSYRYRAAHFLEGIKQQRDGNNAVELSGITPVHDYLARVSEPPSQSGVPSNIALPASARESSRSDVEPLLDQSFGI